MHKTVAHCPPTDAYSPNSGCVSSQLLTVFKVFLHDIRCCGVSFWPAQFSCPHSDPSQILCPLSPLYWQGRTRSSNIFSSVWYCSTTTNTSEFYEHFFSPKAKTQHRNRHYEENQHMIFLHMKEKLKSFGFLLEVLILPAPLSIVVTVR